MTPFGVLVFRIGQLGDTVVSIPAIAAIRKSHPDVPFVLLTDRHPEERGFTSSWDVIGRLGWFDKVIYFPAEKSTFWKRTATMLQTAFRIRRCRVGLVYDLSPYRTAQQLWRDRFFFRVIAGIREIRRPRPCSPPPDRGNAFSAYAEPEWARLLSAVPESTTERFILEIPESGRREARNALEEAGIWGHRRLVAIAPGSKMPAKRWPRDRFEKIIKMLSTDDLDIGFILIGGPADVELCERIRAFDPSRSINIAGKLSVLGTAGALEYCLAYLGNDTGVMHLAAMVGIPCVALFSARDDPQKWVPYGEGHVVLRHHIDCSGCMLEECRDRDNECLRKITTEEVLEGLRSVLGGQRACRRMEAVDGVVTIPDSRHDAIVLKDVLEVPLCDTLGFYFNDLGHTAQNPNDLADSNSSMDESAVFSVLQFGAMIPPLSPWKEVRRFLPGYRYHGAELVGPLNLDMRSSVAFHTPEDYANEIERLLDQDLISVLGDRQDPVLLFSGGVDSGLIASRLAVLGYKDTLLINYSFGEDDQETKLAEAMARHLGLRFERITKSPTLCKCLIEPGRVHPQPFGDPSMVPTSNMAYAVADRFAGESRVIIDGLGADGAFGMGKKIKAWDRLNLIPKTIQKMASDLYAKGLWYQNNKIEYTCRILRRSAKIPLPASVLSRNPLAGILYEDYPSIRIHDMLGKWILGWSGESIPCQIIAAELALTCANVYAQKAAPILKMAGHKVHSPFLHTKMVSLALAAITNYRTKIDKEPLKLSLSRHVPKNMIYRPKSGFVDPSSSVFFDKDFIAYFRAAADNTSPIASLLNQKSLIRLCDLLFRKEILPDLTLDCIWAIVFTDRWYRTANS